MITRNNLKSRHSLVGKVLSNFTFVMLCLSMAYFTAQGANSENGLTNSIAAETTAVDNEGKTSYCKKPTFHPCKDKSVLDFKRHGYKWPVNSTNGTYTVGDQTFEVSINDPVGIFGALHEQADPDDLGSYESGAGLAVGVNPYHRDDEIEIIYKLSKVSDYVAFTIRDLDKKNYQGSSKQIEKVCIYGYCGGVPVTPKITSLCGSVKVKDNCAVATTDSHISHKDESIRVVFDECIDEIKIVYGNSYNAPKNPSYSKIYIGDDIGFGTALCHDKCNKCSIEASTIDVIGTGGEGCGGLVDVSTTGGNGDNSIWVITDANGNIINTADAPPFDFPPGTFLIWKLDWDGNLNGQLLAGNNLQDIVNNSSCAALSNSIEIIRSVCCLATPAAISLEGGSETLDVCVNDETLELVNFTLTNAGNGDNSAWVITDENGIISSTSANALSLNLYAASLGTMQIWYLNWDSLSTDLNVGADINEIVQNSECAALSNPVIIFKDCCCPYTIEFTEANINCSNGNVTFDTGEELLVLDQNLILDDESLVCDLEGYSPCTEFPVIIDSNGAPVVGAVTTAGTYTAEVIPCRCAPPVEFVLTQQLIDECAEAIPAVAPIPQVMRVTESSATISCQHEYPVIIEFRKSGDTTFSSIQIENDMLYLTNLEPCTPYEYRSRIAGANGNSITCAIQTLTTSGCRNVDIAAINLRSLNVSATTAVLTWDNIPGCVYTLYYRIKGQEQWKSYDTTISYVVMFGLNPCTEYEWALRISEDDFVSGISSTQAISTTCQEARLSNPTADEVRIGNLSDLQNIELDLSVNPVSKILTVNYMGLPVKSVDIYNVNAQLVKNLNINNNDLSTIDVGTLKAGVYFLITTFDGGVAKNKFLINK